MAAILICGDQHLANFNKPRYSCHNLLISSKQSFLNRLYTPKYGNLLQGISTWNPFAYRYDLIHTFNEVPITSKPWIGTFESYIPRTIGKYDQPRKRIVRKLLLRENCVKLISLSKYGVRQAEYWNRDWCLVSEMMRKIEVIHPSVPLRIQQPKQHTGKQIRLVFCGRAFAQKGGIVALRLAKIAHKLNFPLQVDLISSMQSGWTDVSDRKRYEADLQLIDLPNVTLHRELPNKDVIELFAASDFQILATLHDTYGYSIIEGFSVGTPAIVTATCALTEMVQHQENGFLLNVDVDELNEIRWLGIKSDIWNRIAGGLLMTDEYWEQQDQTFSDLAQQAFEILQTFLSDPKDYERLSQNAIAQVVNFHNAKTTSRRLDHLYNEILQKI